MTLCECGCGGEAKKGNKFIHGHNNRGKHFSDEHKEKISESTMGRIILEKSKMYGNKNPAKRLEVREKISNTLKDRFSGEKHPMFGKHHTEEAKQKNREKHLGKKPWNKGIPASEESKKRSSDSHFGHLPSPKTSRGKGSYYNSPLQGTVYFRSSYELAYAKYLDINKILWMYEMETFDLGNTTYTPDFFLIGEEKFIEIKGYMRKECQEKINKFLEQYHLNFEILYKENLLNLGIKL